MTQTSQPNPAETYEQYFVPAMFRPWAAVLLRHAAPKPGHAVLDIACGTGIVAREVASLVGAEGKVVALDVNPAMLTVAKGRPVTPGSMIEWQLGNAMSLPFADASFDLTLCQHGLQFFPDRAGAIREMHRVLKRDGRASVIVLQDLAKHPVFEAVIQSISSHFSLPASAFAIPFALSSAEELKNLFLSGGFEKVEVIPETTTVQFPNPERFVPLAVMSSAAAVPAFAQLEAEGRASLLQSVSAEVGSTVQKYREGDAIVFPMYANVAIAAK
ncbi:MAG: Methyltransferase type 11 [Noviherbaspirillum sp.]|nr:Methyltransferase type 11 [Noviherbaspirillum sp.]MDB5794483.1 Methyltransferase type 11 [Noviherbaspirillum sp.]